MVYHKDRYWIEPILYLLYTSPLVDILKHQNVCHPLYADDTQLYVCFATNDDNSPNNSITKIENCLSDINLWTVNKVKLNNSKTDLIYLYSRHNPQTSLPSIQFGNNSNIPTEAVRNLGATFDST